METEAGNLNHEDGDIKSHSYHSQPPKSLSFTWNEEKIDPCQLLEKGNRGNLTDKDEVSSLRGVHRR